MKDAAFGIRWRDVGKILLLLGALALPVCVLAFLAGEPRQGWGFASAAGAYLVLGALLRGLFSAEKRDTGAAVLTTMAIAWLIAPTIGALPFAATWWGVTEAPVVDALFEAMSGFTSCGLTVSPAPEDLPSSVQLWRSMMQWVGGVGIAALMLVAMNPRVDSEPMLEAEVGAVFAGGPKRAALWIWGLYLAMTMAAIGAFVAVGRPWWEALNHGLTAISTGGFTITPNGMSDVGRGAQVVGVTGLLIGAVSFKLYYRALTSRHPSDLVDRRALCLLALVVTGTGLITSLRDHTPGADPTGWEAFFQAGSAVATGGFSTTDLSRWSPVLLGVLALGMFVGGMSGSTAGGLKLERVELVLRSVWWRVRRSFDDDQEQRVYVVERERLPAREARLRAETASTLATIWVLTIVVSAFFLSYWVPEDMTFDQIGFEVVSALSSVGLTAGVTGPEAHPVTKVTLSLLMWLGRLELFAGYYLLLTALRPALSLHGGGGKGLGARTP